MSMGWTVWVEQYGLNSMGWTVWVEQYGLNSMSWTVWVEQYGLNSMGWGTALQAGSSRVRFPVGSLEFFIDTVIPAAQCPRGRLSLQQKWVPGIFPAAGMWGWKPGPFHVPMVLKFGSLNLLEPSGPKEAWTGIALPVLRWWVLYRSRGSPVSVTPPMRQCFPRLNTAITRNTNGRRMDTLQTAVPLRMSG